MLTPVFLTLPVTVAVLKIDEPADCCTVPLIVTVCVPPELSALIVHFTCGATTTQPSVVRELTADDRLRRDDARGLEALRAVGHDDVVGTRVVPGRRCW